MGQKHHLVATSESLPSTAISYLSLLPQRNVSDTISTSLYAPETFFKPVLGNLKSASDIDIWSLGLSPLLSAAGSGAWCGHLVITKTAHWSSTEDAQP